MEYDADFVYSLGVKQQAADAFSRIRTEWDDKETSEEEVLCLFMSSEHKSDDEQTVATVCYDGEEETIRVDWAQENQSG